MPTALVTGGAARIGRAIVDDLARHGWAVAIHTRAGGPEADAALRALEAAGHRAALVTGDLRDEAAVERIVPAAVAAIGPLDLLVNNASVFLADEIATLAAPRLAEHLAVNLVAPLLLARDFAAQLADGATGLVVNIIDQRVWKPTPRFFSYGLSKGALYAATRTMAQGLAPRVRVNAIGPGPTLGNVNQTEDDFARQAAAVPLGRGPALAEFGRTIRWMVEAGSLTGQMVCLDGGQHLAWETPDVVGVGE